MDTSHVYMSLLMFTRHRSPFQIHLAGNSLAGRELLGAEVWRQKMAPVTLHNDFLIRLQLCARIYVCFKWV